MIRRFAGFAGMFLPFWFTAIYFLVSLLRNDYRHFNMAISELGSVGAPNAFLWNLLGYILSGGVIFYLGWVSRSILPGSKSGFIVAWAIAISGMMMLLSGVFPGDFENRTSTTMLLHTLASILSYLFFLVGGFGLLKISTKSEVFKGLHYPLLTMLLLSIVTGFIRYGDMPGLGQRITFACYFAWIAIFGWAVFKSAVRDTKQEAA
jgi:hypothetical membrane protein